MGSRRRRQRSSSRSSSESRGRRRRDYSDNDSDEYRRRKRRSRRREERYSKDRRKKSRRDGERKKYRFDSPPLDYNFRENAKIEDAGKTSGIMSILPSLANKTPEQILKEISQNQEKNYEQYTKLNKKIYVGNIPTGITVKQLLEAINTALDKLGLNQDIEGDSAIDAWISPDGKFFFHS